MFDSNIKILLADDMTPIRKMLKQCLQQNGFRNILEAPDGIKAWELIKSTDPKMGLIISDWNMPNCTGLELLKKIRLDPETHSIPFILVTAESEMEQVSAAIKAGVNDYIVKPFTPEIIKQKLEGVHKRLAAAAATK